MKTSDFAPGDLVTIAPGVRNNSWCGTGIVTSINEKYVCVKCTEGQTDKNGIPITRSGGWFPSSLQKRDAMTPDELYEQGYNDGKAGRAANVSHAHDENYEMGYKDGKGDSSPDARPVDPEYVLLGDAPVGYEFTGEKRVPLPNEWYLSKNGNATYLDRPRRNNQTRHILRRL